MTAPAPLEVRFLDRLILGEPGGHWMWGGAVVNSGYGRINRPRGGSGRPGRSALAHRISYELFVGPIPEGLVINHTCRVRLCVNPHHLEAVTQQANVRYSDAVLGIGSARTCCSSGHEYTPENTYYLPSKPTKRMCRECMRKWGKARVRTAEARHAEYERRKLRAVSDVA